MRILLAHTHTDSTSLKGGLVDAWIARLRLAGFDVESFSLALSADKSVVYFDELNILWRYKDKRLLDLYAKLKDRLSSFDVFVCFNGSNIHPDFVGSLDQITVYGCFDDPESSGKLSRPVANAFDIAMVGNIAEIDTYKDWGVRYVHWWPLGFRLEDFNPGLTENNILFDNRDNDVVLLCERVEKYRKERLAKFTEVFPQGSYYGRGWPAGFLPENQKIPLLQRSKIGINIHNSTGPVNFRTFSLPANGVLQICDNKSNLSKIYKLGEEVIGFDSIEEAIEKTAYYLENEDERREISARGWKRTLHDYNEVACFRRMTDAVVAFQSISSGNFRSVKLPCDLGSTPSLSNTALKNLALATSRIHNKLF